MTQSVMIEREIFIAASAETIFPFFVDPARMAQWIGQQHALDARPGGIFRATLSADAVASGRYTEIVPHRRVAFTWGWEGREDLPPGRSLVEIELEPRDGGTLVRLRHSGLPVDAGAPFTPEEHGERWAHYLAGLERQCVTQASLERSP
jgi:uncharacterized protein YndB with AHSA1/START domain